MLPFNYSTLGSTAIDLLLLMERLHITHLNKSTSPLKIKTGYTLAWASVGSCSITLESSAML